MVRHNERSSSSTERDEDATASTDAGAESSSSGFTAPEPGEDRPDADPWGGGLEPIPLTHDAPEMAFEVDSTSFVDLDDLGARLLDRGADDVGLLD